MAMLGRYVCSTVAALAAGSAVLVPWDAHAFLPGDGKGRPSRDCHVGLDGYSPEALRPTGGGRRSAVVCTDCDPACDLDGVDAPNGACTFRVAACVNQPGIPGCDPAAVKKLKAKATSAAGVLDLAMGLPLDGSAACGPSRDFVVPLRSRGTRRGKGTVALATMHPKDKDRFAFVCLPRPDGEACPPPQGPRCAPPGPGDPVELQLATGARAEPCRYGGLSTEVPPFGGELRDCADAKIGDLGLGCLYLGSGGSLLPGGQTAEPALHRYQVDQVCEDGTLLLAGSPGTGQRDCTLGVDETTRYCINGAPGTDGSGACNDDTQCDGGGFTSPLCLPRPRCFFGPPLPIENGGVSVCVEAVHRADSSGRADPATGDLALTVPLSLRLYVTGTRFGAGQPCPACIDGTCHGGPHDGLSCAGGGTAATTHDCPPFPQQYVGSVDLPPSPLTTAGSMLPADGSIATDGRLCPGQRDPGAFGNANVCRVLSSGAAAPSGFSTSPAPVTLGSTFCVAETGILLIDAAADLPGPGEGSLPATVTLVPGSP